uniref:KRAB domain-containing protein n=1 Tax=Capra hircus TaxID=9925 RepID=A0A8C2S690_CAPHI
MARGPITFRDVVIEFFLHEWEFLNPLQKKLYCIVMMENYSNVVSIGHFISKPHIIVLLEEERDPWMVMKEETRMQGFPGGSQMVKNLPAVRETWA